ncbi:MAG: ATP-binding protein [Desulfovibrio sp.]|nr:ATP-binding protein [Desulfovibrio sp.]
MPELQKLPDGIQFFDVIRKKNFFYVDKTRYIAQLIKHGTTLFLSRPRRFGKSLTVSTLEMLFSGRHDLFTGLEIEKYLGEEEFRPGPVIRLNMNEISVNNGISGVRKDIFGILKGIAKDKKVELSDDSLHITFGNLIKDISDRDGEIVFLIDEYDFPLIEALKGKTNIEDVKDELRVFFSQLKNRGNCIRFIFIAGISRFSRMGIFSALNNIEDISLNPKFATMCGYTQEEIVMKFKKYITRTVEYLKSSEEDLLKKIESYYDGFCFDGKQNVYNPYSTLLFFKNHKFDDFWFKSGTPEYVANYMRRQNVTVEQFRMMPITERFAQDPGELNESSTASYLYQSGYLTLRCLESDGKYVLDYPNLEVHSAMSSLMTWNMFGSRMNAEASISKLTEALEKNNVEVVINEFNKLLSKLPYDDYVAAAKDSVKERFEDIDLGEWVYRSSLLSFTLATNKLAQAEPHSSLGRADMVVRCDKYTWVIEIKIAKTTKEVKKQANAAINQIYENRYAEPYDHPILLGIAIDDSKRSIGAYRFEIDPPPKKIPH